MLEADTVVQGRYRIIRQIRKGGMGTVYLARDDNLGVTVALKQNFFDDPRLIEAFKREARLLAGLRHPALPQVKDYFINSGGQFLVMEYIAGDDLETMLDKRKEDVEPVGQAKPFEVVEVVQWAEQLLDVLDYLHTLPDPVIHRDIKPQNLKLAGRNQIILLDFGLAKGKPVWMTRVTTTGSIYGYTPNYAPLEQIRGDGTDPRSDLYALGATLYHLITGAPPVDAATRADTFIGGELDPLTDAHELNPKVPRNIAALLIRVMELHRNKRPATAAEVLKMLRAAKHSTVIDRRALGEQERAREAETIIRQNAAGSTPEIEIRKQTEAEQLEREEAAKRQHGEEARRAQEEASEALREQREEAARERQVREAAAKAEALNQELARQASEEAEGHGREAESTTVDEPLERLRRQKELLEQSEEHPLGDQSQDVGIARKRKAVQRWKAIVTIVAGLALVALLIWAVVARQSKSDQSLPSAQPAAADTTAPVRKANIDVISNRDWTSTGLIVKGGDRVRINASGTVRLDSAIGQTSGPDGIAAEDRKKLMWDKPTGALIAVIGSDNDDFIFIGRATEFTATREGLLFLSVNEGKITDNSGTFTAVIEVQAQKK